MLLIQNSKESLFGYLATLVSVGGCRWCSLVDVFRELVMNFIFDALFNVLTDKICYSWL
jgi:hypothetical protein